MPAALEVDWASIKAAFVAGATLDELSEGFDINPNTLYARSARENWVDMRPNRTESRARELARKSTEVVADIWAARIERHKDGVERATSKVIESIADKEADDIIAKADKFKMIVEVSRKNLGLDREQPNQVNIAIGSLSDVFED